MALLYGTGRGREGRKGEMEKAKLSLKHSGSQEGISAALKVRETAVKYESYLRSAMMIAAGREEVIYYCSSYVAWRG